MENYGDWYLIHNSSDTGGGEGLLQVLVKM